VFCCLRCFPFLRAWSIVCTRTVAVWSCTSLATACGQPPCMVHGAVFVCSKPPTQTCHAIFAKLSAEPIWAGGSQIHIYMYMYLYIYIHDKYLYICIFVAICMIFTRQVHAQKFGRRGGARQCKQKLEICECNTKNSNAHEFEPVELLIHRPCIKGTR